MKCPCCGAAELVQETREMTHAYKGQSATILVTGDHCPACREVILDKEQGDRMLQEMRAFDANVDKVHKGCAAG